MFVAAGHAVVFGGCNYCGCCPRAFCHTVTVVVYMVAVGHLPQVYTAADHAGMVVLLVVTGAYCHRYVVCGSR